MSSERLDGCPNETERNASERLLVFLQLRKSMSLEIDIDWIKVVAVDEDEDETK